MTDEAFLAHLETVEVELKKRDATAVLAVGLGCLERMWVPLEMASAGQRWFAALVELRRGLDSVWLHLQTGSPLQQGLLEAALAAVPSEDDRDQAADAPLDRGLEIAVAHTIANELVDAFTTLEKPAANRSAAAMAGSAAQRSLDVIDLIAQELGKSWAVPAAAEARRQLADLATLAGAPGPAEIDAVRARARSADLVAGLW